VISSRMGKDYNSGNVLACQALRAIFRLSDDSQGKPYKVLQCLFTSASLMWQTTEQLLIKKFIRGWVLGLTRKIHSDIFPVHSSKFYGMKSAKCCFSCANSRHVVSSTVSCLLHILCVGETGLSWQHCRFRRHSWY